MARKRRRLPSLDRIRGVPELIEIVETREQREAMDLAGLPDDRDHGVAKPERLAGDADQVVVRWNDVPGLRPVQPGSGSEHRRGSLCRDVAFEVAQLRFRAI